MPSNREAYFEALKLEIPKSIIEFALKEVNGFTGFELTKFFDEEIKDYLLFKNAIEKYQNGEMIEYVFGKTYFLSNPFVVNKNVLIPRQETEQLVIRSVGLIKEMFPDKTISIADICTGSGCIGLSIAKSLPDNIYYLTDISKDALKVVKENSINLLNENANIKILCGDMLEPLKGKKLDVIVCNPPYIEDVKTIDNRTWEQEPHLALLATPCTYFYAKLLQEYKKVVGEHYLIAFEIGEDMEPSLNALLDTYCFDCSYSFEKDIYGKTRFLFIKH